MSIRNEDGISRRTALKHMSMAAGALCTGSLLNLKEARAAGEYEVSLQLGWLASNGILGEIAADELGYFADAGLSLNIIAGGPNIDGVASVASGRANLGSISSSPSLMLARSAGIPVKCIAAGYQKHPFTYFSLKGNPVSSPEDLIGKKVATQGTARILLRALLAKNGISEDDVEVNVMGGDMAALMTGQVDVTTGWSTNVNALSILGDQRVDMTLWDAGIQLYANPYYVTDQTLQDHREKVEDMIRAIAKGWGWVYENPEKAVDFLVKRYPTMDKESEMKAVSLINAFVFDEGTASNGWGAMTKENWEAQISTYDSLGQFESGAPALEDLVDFSVLEATSSDRPELG